MWRMTCPGFERITPQLTRCSFLHWGEAKQSMKMRRACEDASGAEVALMPSGRVRLDMTPAATRWIGTIKPTLFPSLPGESVISLPVRRYCICSRDYKYNVENSDDRMTKVNKDMKHKQTHKIYCFLTLFQFLLESIRCSSSFTVTAADRKCKQPAAGIYVIILLMGKPGLLGDGLHICVAESVWSREGISIQMYLLGICSEAVSLAFKSSVDVSLGHRNLSNQALFFKHTFCSILYPLLLLFCISKSHH